MQRGYSLIELMITLAIIAVLVAISFPLMHQALLRAETSAAATDAHAVFIAFKRYKVDNNMYPFAAANPAFQLDTFEPLASMGYYDGRLSTKLRNGRADGYDSPDDLGVNQEFWLEFTLEASSEIRFLIADSDDSLLGGGEYLDGIFLYKGGVRTPLPGFPD